MTSQSRLDTAGRTLGRARPVFFPTMQKWHSVASGGEYCLNSNIKAKLNTF